LKITGPKANGSASYGGHEYPKHQEN